MSRNLLSAAFFFTVFSAAYGGFFYQEYAERQQNDAQAVGPSDTRPGVAAKSGARHARTGATAGVDMADRRSYSADPSRIRDSAPPAKHTVQSRYGEPVAADDADDEKAYNARANTAPVRSFEPGTRDHDETLYARENGQPARTVAMLAGTNVYSAPRASAANRSGYRESVSASSVTSPLRDPADTGTAAVDTNHTADTSKPVSGFDTTNNDTTDGASTAGSSGDGHFTPDFTPREQTETVEQPWPTPNCPIALPDGSTRSDAKNMQQTYGCRYAHYCQMLNDGKGGYRCWWGFYSAS